MAPLKDYYKILQIDPSAEPEVIDAAYKRLMLKYHPDINKSLDASEKAKVINEAYECLKDPIKRKKYDDYRQFEGFQRTGSSSGYSDKKTDEEKRKRENAEREAYAARQQAEKERSNAEYEREKRRKAEAAAQEAQQKVQDYQDVGKAIKNSIKYLHKNRLELSIIGGIMLGIIFLSQLFSSVNKLRNIDHESQQSIRVTRTIYAPTITLPTKTPNSDNMKSAPFVTKVSTQEFQKKIVTYFKDDFSNIDQTKNQWENDESDWIIVDEKLKFVDNGRIFAGNNEWTDYTFSVKVMGQKTIDKIIFFRYTDIVHTYYVFLRSSPINDIVLARTTPELPDKILIRVPYQNNESTWYSLKVVLQGNSIRIYINDALAIDYVDSESPLENGRIGLVANLPLDQNASVFFDDVIVTK